MNDKRAIIAEALLDLVEQAKHGGPRVRVGLMAHGSELGTPELLKGARLAQQNNSGLTVVAIGPKLLGYEDLEWIETPDCEQDIVVAMETALAQGSIDGVVALHYPFPVGVTTIGRIVTPGRGNPMIIASSTGTSATVRAEAMLRNAIYGAAVAKALEIDTPTVGFLNLDGSGNALRGITRLQENGYPITFATSGRGDGGSLLRGNDLVNGSCDVMVCDTLTGNAMMKIFSTYSTGGFYESTGWGYGPSVGEGWKYIVSIISRASGAPVVANALTMTAQLAKNKLPQLVQAELTAATKAGLKDVIASLQPKSAVCVEEVVKPAATPTNAEIAGIDVLDLETAVQTLWRAGIYAESAMGCTGPVIKIAAEAKTKSVEELKKAGFL